MVGGVAAVFSTVAEIGSVGSQALLRKSKSNPSQNNKAVVLIASL